MTTPWSNYQPHACTSIIDRQNDVDALRFLIAQRRLYSRAKRWQGLRWVGLLVLGLAAPVISVLAPTYAVLVGAVAGLWLFLGRTWIASREAARMTEAAAIQEQFDQYVFSMPQTIDRSVLPAPEDIAKLAGDDATIRQVADREKLTDWYPVDENVAPAASVATAQRANAAYTDRLIRVALSIWTLAAVAWAVTLVVWSIYAGISLTTFLLGVVLPILPAALDVFEYLANTKRAARDRGDLARTIEGRIGDTQHSIDGSELLVWQAQMYDLRRTTPQVPDWLYKLTRKKNENAMATAAKGLGRRSAGGN